MAEIQQQHPRIETKYRRVDRNHFTAAIYVDGKKESCCIWMGSSFGGDITFSFGDSGSDNSYNEALYVEDDGYSLTLRPIGLRSFGTSDRKTLATQEAAEYLWSMLIERLQ